MSAPLAVVDLGTHSCLLLVGRAGGDGALEVLCDECEIVGFGEELERTGAIGEAGLARVEALLARYLLRARELGAEGICVGGTAALRRARNQAEVLRRLRTGGIEVEVISPEREAHYGWSAAARGNPATCIIDVGGGSTEVVADGGNFVRSFPVGAVVLTERKASAGWEAMLAEARSVMGDLENDVQHFGQGEWVALGGTASNLASLAAGLPGFDHEKIEGDRVVTKSVFDWGQEIANRSPEKRLELPIEAARASVLSAGLACFAAVLMAVGVQQFRVTGRGLRYGFLADRLNLG